jgi:hypothetical protein
MSTTTTHASSGAGEGENPTDLAARFEAKREECEKEAEFSLKRAYWRTLADTWAEARDMARADAAGGALTSGAAPNGLDGLCKRDPAPDAAPSGYADFTPITIRSGSPPPAQQGSSSPLREGETARQAMYPVDAVAEAWASIDGKDDEYRAGRNAASILDEPGGHFSGYQSEAQELIQRIEKRGYKIVPAALATARDGGTGAGSTGATLTGQATQHSPSPSVSALTGECPSRRWQPIATAPKEGADVLLWSSSPSHADYYIGRYEAGESGAWDTEAGWFSDDGADIDPTHWMPLPAPPIALGFEARQGRGKDSVEDESPATTVATSTPDPRKEALAVLEDLDPIFTPELWIAELRHRALDTDIIGGLGAAQRALAKADRIEAALATLSAADQAGEVR